MKTIDEIINNENYKRLNGALVDRSIEIAGKIREAMQSAEIKEVGDYSIQTVRSRSGFSTTDLYVLAECDDYPVYHCLEIENSKHFANDFNCWMQKATGKERLKFLNDAKSVLEEIEAIKQKRMEDVEDALKAVEGL